jgi:hypothetical protein
MMPWYYAGPEAKPVGPLSVEELDARYVSGIVTSETYVIEHTGQPSADWAWKRYREVFPTNLPPVPPAAILPASPAVPPPANPPQVAAPHPLFPSATSASNQHPAFPADTRPDPYYKIKPTNGWCAWGFGLALLALCVTLATCGIGGILALLLALPALLLCIVGLTQVHKNHEQTGQGLAIAGLVMSSVVLLIALIFILLFASNMIKAHGLTVTEQTSNDSE